MRTSRKTLLICALAALLPLGFQGAQAATATAVAAMPFPEPLGIICLKDLCPESPV